LFKSFDAGARRAGYAPSWDPSLQASLYLILVIVVRVLNRVPTDGVGLDVVGLFLGLAAVVPIVAAQKVANLASGDPEAKANSGIDAGSVVACLVGAAVWALVLIGTLTGAAAPK
jgi:chromate transport protein ChrA